MNNQLVVEPYEVVAPVEDVEDDEESGEDYGGVLVPDYLVVTVPTL